MTTTSGVTSQAPVYGPVGTFPTPSTSGDPTKTAPKDKTSIDKDTFLKLLVAQMKYQDPSAPTDPSQFLSQTAQFTTVEKLDALEKLSQQVYEGSRQQTATAMIGRTVTWTSPSGKSQSGLVSGVSVGMSVPQLIIGDSTLALDDVSSVATTPPATTTPTANT